MAHIDSEKWLLDKGVPASPGYVLRYFVRCAAEDANGWPGNEVSRASASSCDTAEPERKVTRLQQLASHRQNDRDLPHRPIDPRLRVNVPHVLLYCTNPQL